MWRTSGLKKFQFHSDASLQAFGLDFPYYRAYGVSCCYVVIGGSLCFFIICYFLIISSFTLTYQFFPPTTTTGSLCFFLSVPHQVLPPFRFRSLSFSHNICQKPLMLLLFSWRKTHTQKTPRLMNLCNIPFLRNIHTLLKVGLFLVFCFDSFPVSFSQSQLLLHT